MAYVIDRTTKEISARDTVAALADPGVLVFHKREIPADVRACPPQYRVIEGDTVRVATAEEIAIVDAAAKAADDAAKADREQRIRDHAKRLIDGDLTGLSETEAAIVLATTAQAKVVAGGMGDVSARIGRPPKSWDDAKTAAKEQVDA